MMQTMIRRYFRGLGYAGLALVLCASVLSAAAVKVERAEPEHYIEHVKVLASSEMKGRGAGSPELDRAASYIAKQFEHYGLKPGAGDGSFLQPFTVTTGAEMGPRNQFVIRAETGEERLQPGEDYVPFNFSSTGSVTGQVVFAGYGISADEFGYDDYTHFDVKDKIVLILRYEPEGLGEKAGARPGRKTHHAQFISKAINARDRGAKAVLMVNGKPGGGEEDGLLKFGSVAGPEDAGIVMVHLKNSVAEKWLESAGKSLLDLQAKIDESRQPQSFAFPESLTVSLEVDIERQKATVSNVAGYLPGRADEYVIVGAHYDHLGLGDHNSLAPSQIGTVHHGADDNASGTAGLLELARLFSSRAGSLQRGILFLAFAAEEIGLLGSSHWANHPTLPLEKAVAMINMDMIGRIQQSKVYAGGVGTGSGFDELVQRVADRHDFKIDLSQSGYSASDHTSFVGKGIPVLFFFSGLHGDYHKPSDTWEKINSEAAARLLNLVAEVAGELVEAEDRPQFVKVEGSAHGGVASSGGRGYGPYFGSIPDFGQVENGVKFADIQPDSPAAAGGLRAGDILIQFGDKPIKNLYDFTFALRGSKVGEVVEVKVLRDGETVSAQVKLAQRR